MTEETVAAIFGGGNPDNSVTDDEHEHGGEAPHAKLDRGKLAIESFIPESPARGHPQRTKNK